MTEEKQRFLYPVEWLILEDLIEQDAPSSKTDISKRVEISYAYMCNAIDRLIDRGLVRASKVGRRMIVSLSPDIRKDLEAALRLQSR